MCPRLPHLFANIYSVLTRFFVNSVNPKRADAPSALEIQTQLTGGNKCESSVEEVAWILEAVGAGRFYRLAADASISGLPAYRSGLIYGIDLSSAAAVAALEVEPHHHVLDLCSAPGAKLACIFDRMWSLYSNQNPSRNAGDTTASGNLAPFSGTVTGVDVSAHRLQACKSLCQKYCLSRVRLFLCDGSKFDTLAPSSSASEPSIFLPPLPTGTISNTLFGPV